jgi:hypothetical protein
VWIKKLLVDHTTKLDEYSNFYKLKEEEVESDVVVDRDPIKEQEALLRKKLKHRASARSR